MTSSDVAATLPQACDFTVFGGTGDLALRKILPALYHRDLEGHLPPDTRIIGVSRSELDDDGYRAEVRAGLETHLAPEHLDPDAVERLLGRLHHLCLDSASSEGWHLLHDLLKDRPRADETVRVFYLAVAPRLFGPTCARLAEIDVVDERARVVMEKPIGHDLALRPRGQRRGGRGLRGAPDLPHRPLPGQGERPEPAGHPLRQHLPRAAVELALGRPRADHRRRDGRRGQSRRLLRPRRRAARHGAEPPPAAAVPGGHGAADLRGPRERARREAQGAAGAEADEPPRTSTATPCAASTPPG